ncbi:MAG: glycerol-3-phosphate acyltransferase PlsY [Gammaproteobacteria bacterium]|jgi:glycerol-3-phosphate acyltransferase PlsY
MGFTDPRSDGSNNPGATNVLRIAGKKAAVLTLTGDFLKGLIPVLIARWLALDEWLVATTGLCAFLGHCYPLFFHFKGGKGVATSIAVAVAYNGIIGLIVIAIWLLFAKVFKISSLAAIVAFSTLPLLVFWNSSDYRVTSIFGLMSVILIWRHKSNIQRLISGTEA